jgi:fructose-1,6-bisphosphatase/inositol monophosphatase family enzyme
MSNKPEIDDIKAIMREAADRYIRPRYRNLHEDEIATKSGPCDLVTLADIQSEAFIESQLSQIYTGRYVLGEERVSRDPKILNLLDKNDASYFVIDPVDGTSNFVAGNEHFGMLLAYVERGEVVQAYIYDVLKDEFMIAAKGEGAYHEGQKITFSAQDHVADKAYGKYKYFSDELKAQFQKQADAHGITMSILGCSAHEYMQLMKNMVRFYVACNVKPWDHLGGSLLVREAGGVSKKWDGADFRPQDLNQSILCARSNDEWHDLHAKLFQPAVAKPRFR